MVGSAHDSSLLIRTAKDIGDGWLGAVLGVDELTVSAIQRIGTGQISQSHRVRFEAPSGQGSVVVKLASDDPNSRATGIGMGAYSREVTFYANASDFDGPLPACHLAAYDEADGWFTLVLQDVAHATPGDQVRGCSKRDAQLAMQALAQVARTGGQRPDGRFARLPE